MEFSNQYLSAEISKESIEQVRDVTLTKGIHTDSELLHQFTFHAKLAVYNWLVSLFPSSLIFKSRWAWPDFTVDDLKSGHSLGFEVQTISDSMASLTRLRDTVFHAYHETNEGRLDEITIICVMESDQDLDEAMRRTQNNLDLPPSVRILFGLIESHDDPSQVVFKPVSELV